jgi:hypothetical protein
MPLHQHDSFWRYVWLQVLNNVRLDTLDVRGYEDPMAENLEFMVKAAIYVRMWSRRPRIGDNALGYRRWV